MTAKYLFDAEPGELVRTNGMNGPLLGLVSGVHFSDANVEKLLICLIAPDGEESRGPCYLPIHQHAHETALSFGRDYRFVADPAPEAIDPIWAAVFTHPEPSL